MKILALSDQVTDSIYSPQIRVNYPAVDLVLGCGDLPYPYLEFVTTMLNVPLAYVHGNHDRPIHTEDNRLIELPEGCLSLEDRVIVIKGVLLAGLGGSIRYSRDGRYQYTPSEMGARIARLIPQLMLARLRTGRYLDILVTHSPPLGFHDGPDYPHTGFKSLLTLMKLFRPRLMVHGHTHLYHNSRVNTSRFRDTLIMNVYPYRVIDWQP